MSDIHKKHRVIGIRHTLKKLKSSGLISTGVSFPDDAVDELKKTKKKADGAIRHRKARKDSSIPSMVKEIEMTFDLPKGSVALIYPSGRKARSDSFVGALRKKWDH